MNTETKTPRWGFFLDSARCIVAKKGLYKLTDGLAGGEQWERVGPEHTDPDHWAPEGTPIPDPNTWLETHRRLVKAIEETVASELRGCLHNFRFPGGVPVPHPDDIVDGAEVMYVGKGIAHVEQSGEGSKVWFDCNQTSFLAGGGGGGWRDGLTVFQIEPEWIVLDKPGVTDTRLLECFSARMWYNSQ